MFGQVFIASYRLYGLHQTIMSIHSALRITHGHPPRKLLEAFDTQVLLSADKMLGQWNSKLPFFLQSKSPLPKHRIAQCQRSMLRMQYLHMRLLLGRPFLALLAADSEIYLPNFVDRIDTSLSATIAKECAINCILAARELVDLITERGGDEEDRDAPYPSWWNNIRYAISCATVMLAARLCPIAYDDLPAETVETGWDRSIGILVRYRKASPLAVEGLKTLRDLSKAVMDMEDEGESLIRVRNMTWLEVLPCDLSLEVSKNVRS